MVHSNLMVSGTPRVYKYVMNNVHIQHYVFKSQYDWSVCGIEQRSACVAVHLLIHRGKKLVLAHANKIMFLKWWFIIYIFEHFFSLVSQAINQIGFNRNEKTNRIAALGFRYDKRNIENI